MKEGVWESSGLMANKWARSALSYDIGKVDRLVKQGHLGLMFSAFNIKSLLSLQCNWRIHSVLANVSA